jgi:hypothetical protein
VIDEQLDAALALLGWGRISTNRLLEMLTNAGISPVGFCSPAARP